MRVLRSLLCTAVLLGLVPSGFGFSLLGPFAAWQTAVYDGFRISYGLTGSGDIGGPRTLSEGYRWNVPVITYAFDSTFINYFGSNGVAAIEEAIGVFNDLPEVTLITNDGSHFYIRGERVPMQTKRVNFLAQNLGLLDLKSTAMSLLIEELGLAQPERFTWTLGGRNVRGNPAITNYTTLKYNFDPITFLPSSFVNGALYSYEILEVTMPNEADAIEFAVDPLDFTYTSVAGALGAGFFTFGGGLGSGEFFTGLTHDDVGGLKWLYRTNNFAVESLLTNVTGGRPITGGGGGSPWSGFLLITNFFFQGTNFTFNTNIFGTNITNFVVTGLRPGMNKIRFQRVNFDSLVGQQFITITNRFTDTSISNSRPVIQPVQRAILQPDIVFTAERLGLVQNLVPVLTRRTGTAGWQNNDAINGQDVEVDGGPGVITPPIQISFSSELPYFSNQTPFFLDEATAFRSFVWGSFDGSTNAPIIYPSHGEVTIEWIRAQLGLR